MEAWPEQFWQGVSQFNQGDYYGCHDTLEALWLEAEPQQRPCYQGILQIAVALYHLSNGNHRGAMILLGEGLRRLETLAPREWPMDLQKFCQQSHQLLRQLQQGDATLRTQWQQRCQQAMAKGNPAAVGLPILPTT